VIRFARPPRLAAALALAARARRAPAPAERPRDLPAHPEGGRAAPVAAADGRGGRIALLSFMIMVLAPGLALTLYFAVIAADRYESVARFTVREIRTPTIAAVDASADAARLGAGLATDAPSQFNHVVASWLRSRAGLEAVAQELDVAAIFRRPEADFWVRLPEDASAEARADYWRRRVDAVVDGPSGIVTLRVRAFRPDDSAALSEALIRRAEALVNALSERRKRATLERARADAALAEERLASSVRAVAALREAEGLVDPALEAAATLAMLSGLVSQRIALEGELRALAGVMSADAPRIRVLREQTSELDREIDALRASLAGQAGDGESMAVTTARFEALAVERQFADRLFEVSQRRLIEAEIDLARPSVYFGVFEPPGAPEEARYPRRAAYAALAVAGLFVAWAICALIWASVRDHRIA
jgi:capsular polysaccharide transport system permease protein